MLMHVYKIIACQVISLFYMLPSHVRKNDTNIYPTVILLRTPKRDVTNRGANAIRVVSPINDGQHKGYGL